MDKTKKLYLNNETISRKELTFLSLSAKNPSENEDDFGDKNPSQVQR